MAHGAMPRHGRSPVPVLGAFIDGIAALEASLQQFVEIDDVVTCARLYASAALRFLAGRHRPRGGA